MKRLLVPPALLLLAGAVLAQGLPPAAVRTGKVRKEKVSETVTGVATVEPWLRTELGVERAGLVSRYPLREGDRVEAGKTVVCELRRTSLEIDLAEARALLARAEAEAAAAVETARALKEEKRALRDRAEKELARVRKLFAEGVVTQAELDGAEAEASAARYRLARAEESFRLAEEGADPASKAREAEVRRARARLDRVRDEIAKTRVVSPVTGFVVRRLTEVGEWVTPGRSVIEIIALDPVLVRVGVNENAIRHLAVGAPATVTVDALPGRKFAGKVRFLVPEADPRTRSFPVLIEVPNPDIALKAGFFARVSIRSREEFEALTAPKDAVVLGPRGPLVYILGPPDEQGRPRAVPVPVKTGLEVGGRVVVEGKGLADGTVVVTTGNEALRPRQPLLLEGGR